MVWLHSIVADQKGMVLHEESSWASPSGAIIRTHEMVRAEGVRLISDRGMG